MPRLVYACRFDVEETTLDGLYSAYADWFEKHYQKRRKLQNFKVDWGMLLQAAAAPLHGHELRHEFFNSGEGKVCRLRWSFPDDRDSALRWDNSISLGQIGPRTCVEHQVSVVSTDYSVAPALLSVGSPAVIRNLCASHTVKIGEMRLRAEPYPIGIDQIDEFLGLLQSPLRRLPLVFLAPYASSPPNRLNANALAKRLAGVAIIVRASDPEVTWAIGDRIGRPLSCFDGGARIYWPRFRDDDSRLAHPLFLGTQIEIRGERAISAVIERMIFGVACFRFAPDAEMLAVVRTVEDTTRASRLEFQKTDKGMNWEQYALEMDGDLSQARTRIEELEAENANLRANQSIRFSGREVATPDLADAADIEAPATVEEAVRRATQSLQNLVVLPSAVRAAEASPFLRPAEIYDALEDLDEVLSDWVERRRAKGSGGDLYMHLQSRGWGKRCSMHISDTTRTQNGSSYKFEYKGKRQLFEPHITLGAGDANSCASIHFILDEKAEKIIIGHVGRHLPNTKT